VTRFARGQKSGASLRAQREQPPMLARWNTILITLMVTGT